MVSQTATGTTARPGGLRAWRAALLLPALVGCFLAGCFLEGQGDGSPGPVDQRPVDARCAPVAGAFPSGLARLPGSDEQALVVQFSPPALLRFGLGASPPPLHSPAALPALPTDSDSDGEHDGCQSWSEGFCPWLSDSAQCELCSLTPVLGEVEAPFADLALVSASSFEELLFFDPEAGDLVALQIENPAASGAWDPADRLFFPPAGTSALRTALPTRACVYPEAGAVDSLGDPIAPEPRCDPERPGFFTRYTAGKALAAGRLFVVTSNLRRSGEARYQPGTLLVHEFDRSTQPPTLRPDVATPVIFTTGFNPTAATAYTTPDGRELVLVTVSGAIGTGTGASNVRTAGAIDVIDAASARLVATIPLGFAGPSFDRLAIEPRGRVALIGASSERHLYAIDLAPLAEPALYAMEDEVVRLDGSQPGFPDARIFYAEVPFVIPARADGPDPRDCAGQTHVAVNASGHRAFATDFCDGSLTSISLDLDSVPEQPVSRDRFRWLQLHPVLAPNTAASFGLLTAPGSIVVRRGIPGVDYSGPDVFFTAGLPEGQLCAVSLESF